VRTSRFSFLSISRVEMISLSVSMAALFSYAM
jgi:hypothetical protein